MKFCLLKSEVEVSCIRSVLQSYTYKKGEKLCYTVTVFSKAYLWTLWIKSEYIFLFLRCKALICVMLLPKPCTALHQKVLSSLGNWRSTEECSCNVKLNTWVIHLNFSYLHGTTATNASAKCARYVFVFILTQFLKANVKVMQVVFALVFIL